MNAPPPLVPRRGLSTEAQFLKGVGPRLAELLSKARIVTVGDVLSHYPRRYEDRTRLPRISEVRPGDWVTVRGRVVNFDGRSGKRRGFVILRAGITDGGGTIGLVWFNQPWVKRKLENYKGELIAYGQVKEAQYALEIHSPEFELLDQESNPDDFARIVPVYPLVEGLNQWVVRRAVESALENYLEYVPDPLPQEFRRKWKLQPLKWSLRQIHKPESEEMRRAARRRLVFDEFFYLQVGLALKREEAGHAAGISFKIDREKLWSEATRLIPFNLTGAQRRVTEEIWADMASPHPMNRLVQGDVGSGKTIVAALAMLAAVRDGHQAALMAPTEILAEQHFANLKRLFEPIGVDVALLIGKQTAPARKKELKRLASGEAHIVVGTHALIQEEVELKRLGLAVVDEQHRFGVLQRAALRGKALGNPDVLVMTATPIPRTLTMTLYGDLDLSVIDEMPPGRQEIKTHNKLPQERDQVYAGIRDMIAQGRQAYFVCPMVSENEKMLAQAAEELDTRLREHVFPDLRVGLLHGQMKPADKEAVMEAFRRHELDILVSTTVIEVGVDVPNASVMVVEDANRFGLSQLHQLRGRVGRGEYQSYCILIADAKNPEARARIDIMKATTDGFKIAEEDLRLRGPGEIAGTRQSGNLDLKLADLVQDGRMLEEARQASIELLKSDPGLKKADHGLILERARQSRSGSAVVSVS